MSNLSPKVVHYSLQVKRFSPYGQSTHGRTDNFTGTDTTATTIAIGLWHLLHKPDIYARLHDELKTIMPEKDSQPTLKQLENLPFFDACIKEGLRIACPPRGRLPRVVPSEGFQVHDVFLPAGVSATYFFVRASVSNANRHLFLILYPIYSTTKESSPNLWNIGPKGGYKPMPKSWRRTCTRSREAHVCASAKRKSRDITE